MRLRNPLCTLFGSVLLATSLAVAAPMNDDDDENDWKGTVKERETIQKTFALEAAGERSLEVDNVYGSIEVVGGASEQIQLIADKTIHADTPAEAERAKKEVTLDITQEGNRVRLFVNGPFRCRSFGPSDCCRQDERHYVVNYTFRLQVPQRINLLLKTVNGGSVRVQRVRGDYSVNNVNGPIDMEEVGGSGHVRTVNGRVRVSFVENPKQDSDFRTINGNVELYFAPKLAADFRFKTMQGNIYSDFAMTELPRAAAQSERRNGRFVFSADRYTGGRVGEGGPEIKLENLNGDLRVLARSN
ncbi:MAG: hypothetical protein L0Z53_10700 [Acidobacteriales bacterium]|nr:hypothetical protein [Terriglobales bacterium]